jgi:hypothetical protein
MKRTGLRAQSSVQRENVILLCDLCVNFVTFAVNGFQNSIVNN